MEKEKICPLVVLKRIYQRKSFSRQLMGAFYLSRLFSLSMVCFYLKCCFDFLVFFFFFWVNQLLSSMSYFSWFYTLYFLMPSDQPWPCSFLLFFVLVSQLFYFLFFIVFWNVLAPIDLLSFGSSSHCLQRFSFHRNVFVHYIQRYFSPYMRIFFFNSFWIFLNNLSP